MDVRRITPREFYYFCTSTQITLFGISAEVRRKTPPDYYHFAHLRTIQCFIILRIYAQFSVLAFLRTYTEKLRKTTCISILAHLRKLRFFGVSVDVRRKTPRVYYHFAHLHTIQCFGVSADIRKFYCC